MLTATKSLADFSRRCALLRIANAIHLTHPLPLRESTLANASRSKDERGR
jgi:hypothetical protein